MFCLSLFVSSNTAFQGDPQGSTIILSDVATFLAAGGTNVSVLGLFFDLARPGFTYGQVANVCSGG